MSHVELLRNYLASCPGGQRPGVTLDVIGEERPVEQVVAALQQINVSLTADTRNTSGHVYTPSN